MSHRKPSIADWIPPEPTPKRRADTSTRLMDRSEYRPADYMAPPEPARVIAVTKLVCAECAAVLTHEGSVRTSRDYERAALERGWRVWREQGLRRVVCRGCFRRLLIAQQERDGA